MLKKIRTKTKYIKYKKLNFIIAELMVELFVIKLFSNYHF